MVLDLFTERNGRVVCFALVIVDIVLGGSAVFFPQFYAKTFHPNLTQIPVDFIVRTGILWLVFALFQAIAVFSKHPKKWFFAVGIIRLMEVPADIVYGALAMGATLVSRLLIWIAPVVNMIFGVFLYKLSIKLDKYN